MNIDEASNTANVNPGSAPPELEEIEMSFPLKKLVHFAKAQCLDDKVAIHLDKRGFLILQYKIKIYGELRFVVMSINEEEDENDDEDEDNDVDDDEEDPEGPYREDQEDTRKRARE